MTHPGGRPTKYNEDFVYKLEEALNQGLSVERFCRRTRISRDTFYEWVKKHPEFADTFRAGKVDAEAFWQEKAISNFENRNFNTNLFKLYMTNCHGWSDNKNQANNQENEQSQDERFTEEFKALLAKYKREV